MFDPGAGGSERPRRRRSAGLQYGDTDLPAEPDPLAFLSGTPVGSAWDYLTREMPALARRAIGRIPGDVEALPSLGPEPDPLGGLRSIFGFGTRRYAESVDPRTGRVDRTKLDEATRRLEAERSGSAAILAGLALGVPLTGAALVEQGIEAFQSPEDIRDVARRGRTRLPHGTLVGALPEYAVPETAAVTGPLGALRAAGRFRAPAEAVRESERIATEAARGQYVQEGLARSAARYRGTEVPSVPGKPVESVLTPTAFTEAGARTARVVHNAPPSLREYRPSPEQYDEISGLTRADAEDILERGYVLRTLEEEHELGHGAVRRIQRVPSEAARDAIARMDAEAMVVPEPVRGQRAMFTERDIVPGQYGTLSLRSPRVTDPMRVDPQTGMSRLMAEDILRPTVFEPRQSYYLSARTQLREWLQQRRDARQALRNLGGERPFIVQTNDDQVARALTETSAMERSWAGTPPPLRRGSQVARPSDTTFENYAGADDYSVDGTIFDRYEQNDYKVWWRNGELTADTPVPIHEATKPAVAGVRGQPMTFEFAVARETKMFGRNSVLLLARVKGRDNWQIAGTYTDSGPGHTFLGLMDEFKGLGAGPKFLVAAQRLLGRATEGISYTEQGFLNRQRAHHLDVELRAKEQVTGIDEFETARRRAFGELGPAEFAPAGPPPHPEVVAEYPDLFPEGYDARRLVYFAKAEAQSGGVMSWRRVLMPEAIPYQADWSAGYGIPAPLWERVKRAGYRFAKGERGTLDVTLGGRLFRDARTRLAIAPGGRAPLADSMANVRFASSADSYATSPEEIVGLTESLSGSDARWGSEVSAVITTDGRWYRSDGRHHSQWLHQLGLGGSEVTTEIVNEQARFGFVRIYMYGDSINVQIVGRPTRAQLDQLRELDENIQAGNDRLAGMGRGGEVRLAWDVYNTDPTTGKVVNAIDPDTGDWLIGRDMRGLLRALRYATPSDLLRQAVLTPGADAAAIRSTTPYFEDWARQADLGFEREPSVGYGFTRDWGDERDIDVIVNGNPQRAEWYGANLAEEWDQDAFFAVHIGEGDQVVATVPVKIEPGYELEDTRQIADLLKEQGFDGYISVRDGELFVIAPQGMDATEFEFRLELTQNLLREGQRAPDIASIRIERAKVVAYARDEATAERFGIPRENTYAAVLERGGGRARRGDVADEAVVERRTGRTGAAPGAEGQGAAAGQGPHEARVPDLRESVASAEEAKLRFYLQDGPTPNGPADVTTENPLALRAGYDREVMHLTALIGPLTPTEQAFLARRWGGRGLGGAFPGVPRAPRARRLALVKHVEALESRLGRELDGEEIAALAHLYGATLPRGQRAARFVSEEAGFITLPGQRRVPPLTAWDDLDETERVSAYRAAQIRLVELAQQGRPVRATTRGEVYEGNQPRQFSTQTQRLVPGPAGTEGFDPTFQALEAQGQRLAPEIEERTSPITWAATEAAAAMLGKSPREVARGMLKHGVTTAEVELVSTEVARLMNLATDISRRIAIDPASVSQAERLRAVMWVREADELRLSLEQTASELGRGLNILRKRVNEQLALAPDEREFRALISKVLGTADPQKVDALLLQLLAVRDDPRAVFQLLRDLRKSSFWDKAFEYSQANILWAPATHITNTVSGLIQTGLLAAKYVGPGAATEKVLQALTLGRYQPEVAFGDSLPFIQGLLKGYLGAAKKVPSLIRDEGDMTGVRYAEFLKPGPAIGGVKGRVIRTPFTLLTIEDAFQTIPMYTAVREVEIAKLARRAHPNDKAAQRQMIEQLRNEITPEKIAAGAVSTDGLTIHRNAHKIAEEFALHGKGPVLDSLNDLRRRAPGLRYVIRFVNTPYNLAKLGVRHTPVGALRPITDRLTGAATPTRVADAVREAAIGSAVMWWTYSMLESDNATGLWPTNKTERDMWQAENRGPLMVKVGDRWVTALVLGPLLIPFMLGAAVRQVHSADGSEPDDAQVEEVLGWVGRNFADQVPMLQGFRQISDLMDAPFSDRSASILSNMATSFIPAVSLMRAAERFMDTYQRAPKGIGESIQAAIPVLASEGLPQANIPPIRPQRDVFGRPVEGAVGGWAALPRTSQDRPDPVIQEWRRHMEADPDFAGIVRVPDTIGSGSRKIELNSQQYDRYATLVGSARLEAITKVMQSRAYREAQGPQQREMLKAAKSRAEAAGRLAYGIERAVKSTDPADTALGARIAIEAGSTATDQALALDAIRRAGRLTPEVVSLVDQQGHDLTVADYDRGLSLRREYDRTPPFRDAVMQGLQRDGIRPQDVEEAAALLRKMYDAAKDRGVEEPSKDSSILAVYTAGAGGWLRRLYGISGTIKDAEEHPTRNRIQKDPLWDKFRSGARVGR